MYEKKKFIFISVIFFIAFLASVRGFGADGTEPVLGHGGMNALMNETQWMSQSARDIKLIWWIPLQFWRVSGASTDPKPTEEQIQQLEMVLSPYLLFAAVQGQLGPFGGIEWIPEYRLRSSLVLIDQAGREYRPLTDNTISLDAKNLIGFMKPMMSNMVGPMGDNLYFFFFPSLSDEKKQIVDPLMDGFFSTKFGEETHKWRMPLGSLLPPKKCPIDGEKFSGAWKYCPWHGKELVATDAR
jgi:hypothetical protein